MSGYLTSLVRRATAPEFWVRPRLSSIFGPPMSTPRLDIAASVAEDDGIEETIARAQPPRNATAFARQPALPPLTTAEPQTHEAEAASPVRPAASPMQPAASAPRTESVRAPLRQGLATPRIEGPSPHEANEPADRLDVASAPRVEDGERGVLRRTAEPDSERGGPFPPVAASLPPRVRAEPRREHVTEPQHPHAMAAASSPNIDAKEIIPEDRSFPAKLKAADRVSVRQPQRRIEPALRARQAEALGQPTEPPRNINIEGTSSSEHMAEAEAAVTARSREPSAAMREPLPVRSRVSLPSRRDQSIAEAAKAPDPVIQVTIGRVEVRASTPAEPRARPRPANGATGLDDYLRQRTGRGSS
jgi:hypothetical protein